MSVINHVKPNDQTYSSSGQDNPFHPLVSICFQLDRHRRKESQTEFFKKEKRDQEQRESAESAAAYGPWLVLGRGLSRRAPCFIPVQPVHKQPSWHPHSRTPVWTRIRVTQSFISRVAARQEQATPWNSSTLREDGPSSLPAALFSVARVNIVTHQVTQLLVTLGKSKTQLDWKEENQKQHGACRQGGQAQMKPAAICRRSHGSRDTRWRAHLWTRVASHQCHLRALGSCHLNLGASLRGSTASLAGSGF